MKLKEIKETIDKYRAQALNLRNQARIPNIQDYKQEKETFILFLFVRALIIKKKKLFKLLDFPYFINGTDLTWDD